jgi:hypothetical protein
MVRPLSDSHDQLRRFKGFYQVIVASSVDAPLSLGFHRMGR